MLIAIGVVAALISLSFLLVLLIRASRRLSPLNLTERFPTLRKPFCDCTDAGDGNACVNYYLIHNRWPRWCAFRSPLNPAGGPTRLQLPGLGCCDSPPGGPHEDTCQGNT